MTAKQLGDYFLRYKHN